LLFSSETGTGRRPVKTEIFKKAFNLHIKIIVNYKNFQLIQWGKSDMLSIVSKMLKNEPKNIPMDDQIIISEAGRAVYDAPVSEFQKNEDQSLLDQLIKLAPYFLLYTAQP
jgi:hypothetical protein